VKEMRGIAALAAALLCAEPAAAENCANTLALGTWRTITVDPATFGRIGTMQYRQTLPLAPKEVVLTFDDGPAPPMTNKVLDVLRDECVRATFFLIGRNARAHPEIVQRIARDGHTVANHTENHPLTQMSYGYAVQEFDAGFRTLGATLQSEGAAPAPFARFPGLFNVVTVEQHLNAKGVSVLSADFLADDWLPIAPNQILVRALARLEQKGSGILLLHDVQPGTALVLPQLLQELKARGYRIVHIISGTAAPVSPEPAPQTVARGAPTPSRGYARPAARSQAPATIGTLETPETAGAPLAAYSAKAAAQAGTVAAKQTENTFLARWRKYYEDKKPATQGPPKTEYFSVVDR
jgi:peptidoglycan/xylan/chitin deacetylase (PgdA/CDA1 family)